MLVFTCQYYTHKTECEVQSFSFPLVGPVLLMRVYTRQRHMWRWTSVFTTYTHLTVCRVLFFFFSYLPSHSLYVEALERQSFLTWQPVDILFVCMKTWWHFIYLLCRTQLHSWHFFVIVRGVRIRCRQVATFLLDNVKNQKFAAKLLFFLFFYFVFDMYFSELWT